MSEISVPAVVVATIWGLQVFDTALVLTSGGPGTATTTKSCANASAIGTCRAGRPASSTVERLWNTTSIPKP